MKNGPHSFTDDQIDEVAVSVSRAAYHRGRPIYIFAGNGCEDGGASLKPETALRFAQAIIETVLEEGRTR